MCVFVYVGGKFIVFMIMLIRNRVSKKYVFVPIHKKEEIHELKDPRPYTYFSFESYNFFRFPK